MIVIAMFLGYQGSQLLASYLMCVCACVHMYITTYMHYAHTRSYISTYYVIW